MRRKENRKTKKTISILVLICLLTGIFSVSFAEEIAEQVTPELQLMPAELNLQKGRSVKITPSVVNAAAGIRAKEYEWCSSDPEVAEYKNGLVRGLSAGQAVLTCTATLTDGTVLTADCTVAVTVPVSGIRASSWSLTVMAGDILIPEIEIIPEDATNPNILFSSSDEQILSVGADGRVTALAPGKANLTAVSEANPSQKIKLAVTVTKRVGKTDRELTFLGLPWESDCETCISLLKEKGFIAEETHGRYSFTGTAWHWPENDLLFSRISSWRTLPVAFSDRETGAGRTSLKPLKTVGGFLPQTATLIFLNGIGADGQIDPETTRLIGVYFNFDNRHEKGSAVFLELLNRLEQQYGEFNRYLSKDIPRYYQELCSQIETAMAGAKEFALQEPGIDVYLGEYVVCTIHGAENTGIMLNMDTSESVTLFYGRTDAMEMIDELQQSMSETPAVLEDAGV